MRYFYYQRMEFGGRGEQKAVSVLSHNGTMFLYTIQGSIQYSVYVELFFSPQYQNYLDLDLASTNYYVTV